MDNFVKILLFGINNSPVFEVGERLSLFHEIELVSIDNEDVSRDTYFTDRIPEVDIDAGDWMSGSASQSMVRCPDVARSEKQMDSLGVGPVNEPLSDEELAEITSIHEGIIVTEVADERLVKWATHVIFLDADMSEAILWFGKRRKCYSCGAVFHLEDKPSQYEGICDRCGSDLQIKEEDKAENVKMAYKAWRTEFMKMRLACRGCANFIAVRIDKFAGFEEICEAVDNWLRKTTKRVENNFSELR